ncbi:hypothetical protein [Pseudarthrobacter siccitolerans]
MLIGIGSVTGMAILAASPHIVRVALRPKNPGDAVPLAWRQMVDLGTVYGIPLVQ